MTRTPETSVADDAGDSEVSYQTKAEVFNRACDQLVAEALAWVHTGMRPGSTVERRYLAATAAVHAAAVEAFPEYDWSTQKKKAPGRF